MPKILGKDSNSLIVGTLLGIPTCLVLYRGSQQTLEAIGVTDSVVNMPVFRPVIGMDKEEIVTIARKIGTMETSILPYEDCCTVFTPRHPKTKPTLGQLLHAEEKLDRQALIEQAMASIERIKVAYHDESGI